MSERYPEACDLGHGNLALLCGGCEGEGVLGDCPTPGTPAEECGDCEGKGFLGVNPFAPTTCRPGSVGKLIMLKLRYHAGAPMHHPRDGKGNDGATDGIHPWEQPLTARQTDRHCPDCFESLIQCRCNPGEGFDDGL